jgi:hypothetical protein
MSLRFHWFLLSSRPPRTITPFAPTAAREPVAAS